MGRRGGNPITVKPQGRRFGLEADEHRVESTAGDDNHRVNATTDDEMRRNCEDAKANLLPSLFHCRLD